MINVEEIKERISSLMDKGDNEDWHIREDDLYLDVLREIASGSDNAQELAKAVLEASELKYGRWYA